MAAHQVWVWRFPLSATTAPFVALPIVLGAKLLRVDLQGRDIALWYEVDPTAPVHTRRFEILLTGGRISEDATYCGTVLLHDGRLVLHVYELPDA